MQGGAIAGLVDLLGTANAPLRARADAAYILKRLTASSSEGRSAFLAADGADVLRNVLLSSDETSGNRLAGLTTPPKSSGTAGCLHFLRTLW